MWKKLKRKFEIWRCTRKSDDAFDQHLDYSTYIDSDYKTVYVGECKKHNVRWERKETERYPRKMV